MLNLFHYVGVRHLKAKPVRTLLTTVGVALGIALFVAIEIINRSTLASFRENVEAVSGKATLIVSAGETGFPEDRLEWIRKTPGVKAAVPLIESRGYFPTDPNTSETLMILGVDLLQEQSVRTYKTTDEQIIDDPLVFLNQPDSLIVTHEFARSHHLQIDSPVVLATARGKLKLTVRGMLTPEGPAKAYGGSIAIMDIDGARVVFGKEGKLDRVDVVTKAGENLDAVAQRLRDRLGVGYQVEQPESQSEGMARMVKSYQTMMTLFSTLALFVGLFLITNSMSIAVAERRREIGTLRALGATRKGILGLFLSEAMAMGAMGACLGAWLGRGMASIMVHWVSRSMSSQFLTHIQVSTLHFGAGEVLRAVALGAVTAFFAAAWPAIRATQIQPLEAMRNREVGEAESRSGFYRWSGPVGFSFILFVTFSAWMKWPQRFPALEELNQVLSMVGAALLGPSVVVGLVRFFRPWAKAWGGPITRLSQDNLVRNPKRTASNVMSLMVGLLLVVLIASVNVSFQKTIQEWFGRILKADLIVSSTGQLISYKSQPLHESLGAELETVPGVKKGPRFGAYGLRFLHVPFEGKKIAVKAYDEPDPIFNYSTIDALDRPAPEAGHDLYHSENPVALVSENFVLHFAKKTGDSFDLETPSGLVKFKVVGVVADFASDVGVIYLSRDQYKVFWKDPLVNAFGIQLQPGYSLDQVRKEIDRRYGQSKSLMAVSNAELRKQMTEIIDQSFTDTRAVEAAALAVGLLGLLNTLLISVMERMREIGMLRAIGMSRAQVSKMILQEALFQGGFGAVTAVVLGGWFAYIWITYSLSHVLGWVVRWHFPWSSIGTTLVTGLGVALIAGFFPARRAANLEITEALEYE